MKKITIALLSFLTFFSSHAQFQISVPETWETDVWIGADWTFVSIVTYTFNTECLPTQGLLQSVNFGTGVLENSVLLSTTYNANNLIDVNTSETWNSTISLWENSVKSEFGYDTNNNLITSTNFAWITNTWVFTDRLVQTYSTSNLLLTSIAQNWDGTNWIDNTKAEFTYNPNNSLDVTFNYTWDGTNWIEDTRETYIYSGNLVSQKELSNWDGTNWINKDLIIYTYDGNDFLINTLEQTWNGTLYEDEQQIIRTNNANGNPTERITQEILFGNWVNTTRDTRTYPNCETLSTIQFSNLDVKVYPNPVEKRLFIDGDFDTVDYSVLDLNGRILISNTNKNSVDVSNLSQGMYLLIIENEGQITTKKFTIKR